MLLAHRPLLRDLPEFEPTAAPVLTRVTLPSGLAVWLAATNRQCWDAPLPCTAEANPALRLRRPGELESGLTLQPPPHPATAGSVTSQ